VNRLIAFLRDSYREAVSGWMLQVMLVFAVLLVLFIASIGFRPVTLEEQLGQATLIFNRILPSSPEYPNLGSPRFTIENVEASNPAEPWKSDYAFDFVVTTPTAEDIAKLQDRGRTAQLPMSRATTERFLKRSFDYLKDLKVTNAPDGTAKPNELRFHATSHGTAIEDARAWAHKPSVLFAFDLSLLTMSLRSAVYLLLNYLVSGVGAWVVLAVSVVVTAGFVPNMLSKGSIDLLVSKPVSKPFVLVAKYLGGLTFIFLLTSFTALGVWVVLGLRTGIWSPNFLLIVPILTLYFAVLYAVSTLAGVLTRNSLVAILATFAVWALFWGVGKLNDGVMTRLDKEEKQAGKELDFAQMAKDAQEKGEQPDADDIMRRIDPDAWLWGVIPPQYGFNAVRVVHAVTPRTYQLDARLGRIIAEGVLTERELKKMGYGDPPRENWLTMVGVSVAFIGLCLALASGIMVLRDG
jgi:hypothetical protein